MRENEPQFEEQENGGVDDTKAPEDFEQSEESRAIKFKYPSESKPESIQTYGDRNGEFYDVYKLIAIAEEMPEENVSVEELAEKVLDERTWYDANRREISPREIYDTVKQNEEKHNGSIDWRELQREHPELAYHFEKLDAISYETPILLNQDIIVDGVHRVLKAYIDGAKEIKAKRFTGLPESALLDENLKKEIRNRERT